MARSRAHNVSDMLSAPPTNGKPVTLRPCRDRRDVATRHELVQRVAGEFREIPGLCVTVEQASRLFGMSTDSCERILQSLCDDGVVQRAGRYYGVFRGDFVGSGFLGQKPRRHHG